MSAKFKRHSFVMVLCFIIGGFAITAFLIQAYTNVWDRDFLGLARPQRPLNITNTNVDITTDLRPPESATINRSAVIFSPISIMTIISGAILILAGLSIWSLTREKELKSTKEKLTNLLLLPEERSVINELKKAGGQITQSQLVVKTGLSKVKMHRVVKSLAMKGIVKKYQYGLTNKIVLEKEV